MDMRKNSSGYILPEILTSIMIGLIMICSALGLFEAMLKQNQSQTNVTEAQNRAISTLHLVSRDLRMVNFGQPVLPFPIGGTEVSEPIVVEAEEPETEDPAPDEVTFITGEPVTTLGSDAKLGDTSLILNSFDYFIPETRRTICIGGLDVVQITELEEEAVIEPPLVYSYPAGTLVYILKGIRYYVDDDTLMRTDFADGLTMPVSDGVKDFQIQYGLDTDDDDAVDTWMNNPGSDSEQIRSARVWVLIRSAEPDFSETRSYSLGNRSYIPEGEDQHYRYRVLRTQVKMRNMG